MGAPNDTYEQEADCVSDAVMRTTETPDQSIADKKTTEPAPPIHKKRYQGKSVSNSIQNVVENQGQRKPFA